MRLSRANQFREADDPTSFHLWSGVAPGVGALEQAELKKWATKLLRRLAQAYAVRLQGFAFAGDQFHLVLQWTPGAAAAWTDEEVAARWLAAHPARERNRHPRPMDESLSVAAPSSALAMGAPPPGAPEPMAGPMAEPLVPLARARQRLANLSAFLQLFKQLITFKVQRLTGAKGSIWRGRFKMAALQDASALAGAMAFVDLLPAAQGNAERPEESPFTSLHARVALYKGKFGMTPYAPLAAPDGYWQPFPPEVAAELREGASAGPNEGAGAPTSPPAMENPLPAMPEMPPVTMPGMEMGMEPPPMMPPVAMPGMGETPPMPDMPGGSWSADPPAGAPLPWVNSALREDGPGGVLAWLSLRQYLQLLDTLVARAKAWPHVPHAAPGRAPPPAGPAWEGPAQAALQALGLDAAAFAAQWARWARLRG